MLDFFQICARAHTHTPPTWCGEKGDRPHCRDSYKGSLQMEQGGSGGGARAR